MSAVKYTGIVHGRSVLLEDATAPLPEGTRVLVTPLTEQVPERGTTEALLAAIQAAPHVSAEDVAELEAILEVGKQRPSPPTF